MAVNKIEAFEVDGKVFTDEVEAEIHNTKGNIVIALKGLDIAISSMKDNLNRMDLDDFTLKELKRVGRMAEEILNLK
jgi:hypothetical protein